MRHLLVAGAIVPHAPLLLPEVSGPRIVERAGDLLEPLRRFRLPEVDAVVIVSPHGSAAGVYEQTSGDLAGFGCPEVAARTIDAVGLQAEIARVWSTAPLVSPLDHGIVVPLRLGVVPDVPAVAAVVPDGASGKAFADGLAQVAGAHEMRIAVIVSAHTAAALTDRAPLAHRAEAIEIEDAFLRELRRDAGAAALFAADLGQVGGSCSAGPLTVFGSLFSGRVPEIVAYARPFGVGYLAAIVA